MDQQQQNQWAEAEQQRQQREADDRRRADDRRAQDEINKRDQENIRLAYEQSKAEDDRRNAEFRRRSEEFDEDLRRQRSNDDTPLNISGNFRRVYAQSFPAPSYTATPYEPPNKFRGNPPILFRLLMHRYQPTMNISSGLDTSWKKEVGSYNGPYKDTRSICNHSGVFFFVRNVGGNERPIACGYAEGASMLPAIKELGERMQNKFGYKMGRDYMLAVRYHWPDLDENDPRKFKLDRNKGNGWSYYFPNDTSRTQIDSYLDTFKGVCSDPRYIISLSEMFARYSPPGADSRQIRSSISADFPLEIKEVPLGTQISFTIPKGMSGGGILALIQKASPQGRRCPGVVKPDSFYLKDTVPQYPNGIMSYPTSHLGIFTVAQEDTVISFILCKESIKLLDEEEKGQFQNSDLKRQKMTGYFREHGLTATDYWKPALAAALFRNAKGFPASESITGTAEDPGDLFAGRTVVFRHTNFGEHGVATLPWGWIEDGMWLGRSRIAAVNTLAEARAAWGPDTADPAKSHKMSSACKLSATVVPLGQQFTFTIPKGMSGNQILDAMMRANWRMDCPDVVSEGLVRDAGLSEVAENDRKITVILSKAPNLIRKEMDEFLSRNKLALADRWKVTLATALYRDMKGFPKESHLVGREYDDGDVLNGKLICTEPTHIKSLRGELSGPGPGSWDGSTAKYEYVAGTPT